MVDDGWAAGPDWPARMAAATAALDRAGREGRRAALLTTTPSETAEPPRVLGPMPAEDLRSRLAALRPKPWAPDHAAALAALQAWRSANPGAFASLLVSDGIEHALATAAPLQVALAAAGPLTLARAEARVVRLLPPPVAEADRLRLTLQQLPFPVATEAAVLARTGDGRALARAAIAIPAGATQGEAALELPIEIRNQVVRLEVENDSGAGSTVLLDERFRRRPVGLLPGVEDSADAPLIGDLFYLDRALGPFTELRRGPLDRLLSRPIAVLALADRPVAEGAEREQLTRWVERGGTLIRFAGPRIAEHADSLLPVPLRAERQLGGSLSWEQPQHLAPFPETSPFAGLAVPAEVSVERQVLAEPSPRLSERTWARLTDGTPLVTAEARGQGRVVLFHVTANAEWSNLPLSGLFVQMLRRIVALSAGVAGTEGEAPLAPVETLDGFGRLGPPRPPPPRSRRRRSRRPCPPRGIRRAGTAPGPGCGLAGLSPRAQPRRRHPGAAGGPPATGRHVAARHRRRPGRARPRPLAARGGAAAAGRRSPDRPRLRGLLRAGLRRTGLAAGRAAGGGTDRPRTRRWPPASPMSPPAIPASTRPSAWASSACPTSSTAAPPRRWPTPPPSVPGSDDLSLFPLLYWVVTGRGAGAGRAAVAALNTFMRNGGIILFDTRDEGSGEGFAPGARAALRRVTRDLAIPPLAPLARTMC